MTTSRPAERGLEISQIRPEQIAAWHRAVDEVSRERLWLARTDGGDPDKMAAFAERICAAGHALVVASLGDTVIGWADITPIGHGARAHVGGLGMGVVAGHRGQGLGTRLLAAALRGARTAGLGRVELKVRAANAPAIALYARAGFAREGLLPGAWRLDGVADDLVFMGLALFPSDAAMPGLALRASPRGAI